MSAARCPEIHQKNGCQAFVIHNDFRIRETVTANLAQEFDGIASERHLKVDECVDIRREWKHRVGTGCLGDEGQMVDSRRRNGDGRQDLGMGFV